MSKYEPLADFLKDFSEDSWDASFSEIEDVLGFPLPPSAHEHRAWWANQYKGNHSQAKGWIQAGWETRDIDQRKGKIRFERMDSGGRRERGRSDHELWRHAKQITGIADRAALERAAVQALIQREAGRALAELGGTMPDLVVPERERPER